MNLTRFIVNSGIMRPAVVAVGYAVFYVGLSLQLALALRQLRIGLWRRYPFFFAYLTFTTAVSFLVLVLRLSNSSFYAWVYWFAYMTGATLRFAVVWEVFRQIFPRDFSLRRVAAGIFASALVLLALVFYLIGSLPGGHLIADFMRKIALSDVVLLLTILALARYYRISLGRNVWGMAVGLLALVSSYVADYAAIDLSARFGPIWSLVTPLAFILMLLIWVVTLWSYDPNPKPVASDAPAHEQARSFWEKRWAAIGTTIRRAVKP